MGDEIDILEEVEDEPLLEDVEEVVGEFDTVDEDGDGNDGANVQD